MKLSRLVSLLLCSLPAWHIAQAQPPPATQPAASRPASRPVRPLKEMAKAFVDALVKGDFAAATQDLDPQLQEALPAERVKGRWESLLLQYGPFKAQLGVTQETVNEYEVVSVVCQFERGKLEFQLAFDKNGRGVDLTQMPVYTEPDYADPQAYTEEQITIGSGHWVLPATLALPAGPGPFPVVILIHDLGPFDRDQTIGPNKMFSDLALALASRGIAVLRYDTRIKEHAEKIDVLLQVTRGIYTAEWVVIEDVMAALVTVRKHKKLDEAKVFLLGHGLGGMLAPRIGAKDAQVAGFIIAGGISRPLQDVLYEQMVYYTALDGKVDENEQQQLETAKRQIARSRDPKLTSSAPAEDMPFGLQPEYWLDLRKYDPLAAAKGLAKPMFIIQAGLDHMVGRADYAGWQKALSDRKEVTFKYYPKLNHLFMEGQPQPDANEYLRPAHVDQLVVEDLAAWLKKTAGSDK